MGGRPPDVVICDANTAGSCKRLCHTDQRKLIVVEPGASIEPIVGTRFGEYAPLPPMSVREKLRSHGGGAKDSAGRKKVLTQNEIDALLGELQNTHPELAACVKFLHDTDPNHKKEVHNMIVLEMCASSPNPLIILAPNPARACFKECLRLGEGGLASAANQIALKKWSPLFGLALDTFGERVAADGVRFPLALGGYLAFLAKHAIKYWEVVRSTHRPDLNAHISYTTVLEDLQHGEVLSPVLRGFHRTLRNVRFFQDGVNATAGPGGPGRSAEASAGFACHKPSAAFDDKTYGVRCVRACVHMCVCMCTELLSVHCHVCSSLHTHVCSVPAPCSDCYDAVRVWLSAGVQLYCEARIAADVF